MTRFLLSLDQAVDTVFAALGEAKRGETYIPRVSSATVLQIAQALIGERNIEIRVIGIRPGEKIHEILVSEEEANHCVERGKYYAILPMLPELRDPCEKESCTLTKEFSSADVVLDRKGTLELLKRNRLMVEDLETLGDGELLR
jgi:UDP-glucose 4-epimerase